MADRRSVPDFRLRRVRLWLLGVAALIFLTLVVGGATRLTESGLSIVEWKPVTGVLPPLSEPAWQAEFDKYKTIPQYRERNAGMSLADFKTIYWWEWTHRVLARLVGAVFLMQAAGFTVNLLTLLALVLSVGLVVDDAIVMVENVERHLHEGKSPHRAAIDEAVLKNSRGPHPNRANQNPVLAAAAFALDRAGHWRQRYRAFPAHPHPAR